MLDMLQLRKDFRPNLNAHSAFVGITGEDTYIEQKSYTCMSTITYMKSGSLKNLAIFFGKNTIERYTVEKSFGWCSWVINDSFWAPAFITKDPYEGLAIGFEMDVFCDRVMLNAAMSILRHPFEFANNWAWDTFMNMGYDEYESFALALNISIEGDKMHPHVYNSNHKVILPCQKFDLYKGAGYKPAPELGTLGDGCNGWHWGMSIDNWGCDYANYQRQTIKLISGSKPLTKENCDKILNTLKGL